MMQAREPDVENPIADDGPDIKNQSVVASHLSENDPPSLNGLPESGTSCSVRLEKAVRLFEIR